MATRKPPTRTPDWVKDRWAKKDEQTTTAPEKVEPKPDKTEDNKDISKTEEG